MRDDVAQQRRDGLEFLADGVRALHGVAVPGDDRLGPQPGHLLGGGGPLLGVALHLAGVARVGQIPHNHVPRGDHPALGGP
ncbi:MAG: hypothetical protein ABI251_11770, partial [Mycobacteriaceae bacterium]